MKEKEELAYQTLSFEMNCLTLNYKIRHDLVPLLQHESSRHILITPHRHC